VENAREKNSAGVKVENKKQLIRKMELEVSNTTIQSETKY
jgi:hypothetical protein